MTHCCETAFWGFCFQFFDIWVTDFIISALCFKVSKSFQKTLRTAKS